MWLKDEGFVERVHSWWDIYYFQGALSFVLENKLKMLKNDLKKWNVEVFGSVEEQGKQLWKDLSKFETIEESHDLTEEKLDLKRIQGELEKASPLEEICSRQKFGVLCIREGDGKAKFFHCIANSHRRFNSIDRLMVDGELSSDPEVIAECISRFYRQLYSEDVVNRPVLDDVEFSRISEEDAIWLDRPFDEDEVYRVIHGFNGDKTPSSDGFSMAFFSVLLECVQKGNYKSFLELSYSNCI